MSWHLTCSLNRTVCQKSLQNVLLFVYATSRSMECGLSSDNVFIRYIHYEYEVH